MTEYKSEVKHIAAGVADVYGRLSDLAGLGAIQSALADPAARKALAGRAGGRVTPEQMDKVAERLAAARFDRDSVSCPTPLGQITLRVTGREENKTVKYELEGAPVQAALWAQTLPEGDGGCALRLVARAELSFLVRQMVGGKVQKGVDALADALAAVPYNAAPRP